MAGTMIRTFERLYRDAEDITLESCKGLATVLRRLCSDAASYGQ